MAKATKSVPTVPRWPSMAPAETMKERLDCIEASGARIQGYVTFMRGIEHLTGTSHEAKENAVAAFYQLIIRLERDLARVQEELQLG